MKTVSSKLSSSAGSWLGVAGVCAAAIIASQRFLKRDTREKYDLTGKVALITGGSRGFGLAIARELGSRGVRLALCARDGAELDRAKAALTNAGIEAECFPADITQSSEIRSLVDAVLRRFGQIDILVNDAGRIAVGSFDTLTHADYEEAMNLMFWAPVNLTYAVLPHMRERRSGQIINITSIGGRVSIPHLLPYSCAKFALVGFSTGLGSELRSKGIDVLTVIPGLMRTGSYLNAEFKGKAKQEFAWFGLLGNLPGFSVPASYAASLVVRSIEARDQVCTISFPAKVLAALDVLAPEITRSLLELADRYLLPESSGGNSRSGRSLNASLNLVFQGLTTLGKLAASNLNEVS